MCQDAGMTDDPGLRERKKRLRRARIEAAAISLFEQHGFDNTTIEEIADAAEISPRTFFSYFSTKEDVVLADYASRLDRIVDELRGRPSSETAWVALRESFVVVGIDYAAAKDELVRRFSIMAVNPSVYARSLQLQAGWEDAIAGVLVQRTDPAGDELGCRLQAAAALAAMRSSIRHWLSTAQSAELPALVAACFTALADGLSEIPDRLAPE